MFVLFCFVLFVFFFNEGGPGSSSKYSCPSAFSCVSA